MTKKYLIVIFFFFNILVSNIPDNRFLHNKSRNHRGNELEMELALLLGKTVKERRGRKVVCRQRQ